MKHERRHFPSPSRRSVLRLAAGVVLGAAWTGVAIADEKKSEKPKDKPALLLTLPLALSRGAKQTMVLRGLKLDTASEVKASAGDAMLEVKIKSKGKAESPKPPPAINTGDTQVEIELQIPSDAAGDEVRFTIVTPAGETESHAVRLYDSQLLMQEKEPNNGFSTAQEIHGSITVAGLIEKENDVDLFRFRVKSGQKLKAEVEAARLGSPLDSLLTLYDERREVVTSNDDTDTADSLLNLALPHDGEFYLSITDAYGNGGATYAYLLHVELA